MMTDFDRYYDRRNTDSVKWDTIQDTYQEEDLLPLWVADMDFKAPEAVTAALTTFAQRGIYGYQVPSEGLYESIIHWEATRYGYHLDKEDILFSPGVVPSIGLALQALTQPGDAVMIHDPVYPPFAHMVTRNQRKLVRNTLIEANDLFQIDFAAFEAQLVAENVKAFILCNPHNPGGRVWEKAQLLKIGALCRQHGVIVISDEIHQDLVFAPHQHCSFHTVAEDFQDFSVVLTAATKTFNLAGVKHSMIFVKNPQLKEKLKTSQEQTEQDTISTFGLLATEAAYQTGGPWLTELLAYLEENVTEVCQQFQQHLPQVGIMRPQGTYLMWLDFSAFGLTDKALQAKLIHEAKVVLNPGFTFGPAGHQHMRLNTACPRSVLLKGLQRIITAFQ